MTANSLAQSITGHEETEHVPLSETSQENSGPTRRRESEASGPRQQIAGTTPQNVGGALDSDRIIQIAWTFDDGPTEHTAAMENALGSNVTASTWYIQRDFYMRDQATNRERYRRLQQNGGEIAIHGIHPNLNHAFWFPSDAHASHNSISEAMQNLRSFQSLLAADSLNVAFVRLPGGLISELVSYLTKQGVQSGQTTIARQIINGEAVSGQAAQDVKNAYDVMVETLDSLRLHLWGGRSGSSPEIQAQSWEAETSGSSARTDNTTRSVHPSREDENNGNPGVFERTVDRVKNDGRLRSLVLLAHDTTAPDVAEVSNDNATMNAYASQQGVKIEYHTMSSLYQSRRGVAP